MTFTKHLSASVFLLALLIPSSASAKTPPEVLKAYKAYNSSMQTGDYKSAIKHAKTAWEQAESKLGSHSMTGDLAYNYGYVEKNQGDKGKAIKAFVRSIELAELNEINPTGLRLEREVELISSMDGISKNRALEKQINTAINFAKSNGMEQTVFVGELYVHMANICARRLRAKMSIPRQQLGSLVSTASNKKGIRDGNKKCAKIAKRAVDIFDSSPQDTRPAYVANANNYVGYGLEVSKSWLEAALSYQKARNAIEDTYPRDHPLMARTIGRWMNARNFLKRNRRLDYAESNGLCKCWPYSGAESQVEVIKWVKPDFPAQAYNRSSGYAIVQLDVNDEGAPYNIKIMNSWPGDVYDKSALDAAKQLEFSVKTVAEPSNYRKDVIIPFNYFLSVGLEPI